jgi:hypothetical protein
MSQLDCYLTKDELLYTDQIRVLPPIHLFAFVDTVNENDLRNLLKEQS